jgi:hypothetical protein
MAWAACQTQSGSGLLIEIKLAFCFKFNQKYRTFLKWSWLVICKIPTNQYLRLY